MSSNKQKLPAYILERIKGYCLMADAFMNAVFDGNIPITQFVLRIILGNRDLVVKSVVIQKYMKNLKGRDSRLDIVAEDKDGNKFNIEIQNDNDGAHFRRARNNSSILDTYMLTPGQDDKELRDSYVIFITANDVVGRGLPIYRIERMYEDNHEIFDDGEHIIYVNGADQDDTTELGRLMHDFFCIDADDMNYEEMAESVRRHKETEYMSMRPYARMPMCSSDL